MSQSGVVHLIAVPQVAPTQRLKVQIMNKQFRGSLVSFGKRIAAPIVGLGALLGSQGAFAVIDVTAATDGIAAAQVAVLAVLAAMITMAAAVYGVRKVLRLLGR